jgi:hypothetical protein
MSFSDDAEAKVLDHVFGLATYTQPTLYVGVSTADPGEDGATLAEPSGNAYARVATTAASWERTAAEVSNAAQLAFPEATGAWGSLTHFAVFDAATAGNIVFYGALTTAKAIAANETLRFPIGNLTFTLD